MNAEHLQAILGEMPSESTSVEDLLEAAGRRQRLGRLDATRPEPPDLSPYADELAALDLTGRPDAQYLVASLLCEVRRHPEPAKAMAEAARTAYADAGDDQAEAQTCRLLGYLAWWFGDADGANQWWDQADGLPAEAPDPARVAPFRTAAELIADGQLRRAIPETHHAYAITVSEGSVLDEAHATLLTGLLAMDTGDFDRAVEVLERADDLFAEVEPARLALLWPLVTIGLGHIAARRGDVDRAQREFATAETRAVELERPAMVATAHAMPALVLSDQVDGDLLGEALEAAAQLGDDESFWLARQVVERAIATAHLAAGDAAAALAVAETTAAEARNPLLRAKALLLVARARRMLGRADAAEPLDEAVATFLSETADIWLVEALIERADSDSKGASAALDLAYAHTHADPAFDRLWRDRPRLVVELRTDARPVFRVGEDVLALGAKGERLTEVVVRAGEAGIHWETVAARLWPDEDDADRIKSRLTSLTALVRGRLGADGWRLRRDGPRFRFVALAAEVVIVADESRTVPALSSL